VAGKIPVKNKLKQARQFFVAKPYRFKPFGLSLKRYDPGNKNWCSTAGKTGFLI